MYEIVEDFKGCEKKYALVLDGEMVECFNTEDEAKAALEATEETEDKAESDAPNYREAAEDENVCGTCAWNLEGNCILYEFEFKDGWTCDSWTPLEEKELNIPKPHGYLVASGKQTAIATPEELTTGKPIKLISNGEIYGSIVLGTPSKIAVKDFQKNFWFNEHRIRAYERVTQWPESDVFNHYRIKEKYILPSPLPYKNGKIDKSRVVDIHVETDNILQGTPPEHDILTESLMYCKEDKRIWIHPSLANTEVLRLVKSHFGSYPRIGVPPSDFIPLYSLVLKRNKYFILERKQEQEKKNKDLDITENDNGHCVIDMETEEIVECWEGDLSLESALQYIEDEGVEGGGEEKKYKSSNSFLDQMGSILSTVKSSIDNQFSDLKELFSKNDDIFEGIKELPEGDIAYPLQMKNGEIWHISFSTNAFEDRHAELFTTEGLENYVKAADVLDSRGYFNFWHIPETEFAKKEFQAVIGRFLFEAGPYLEDEKGRLAKEFFTKYKKGHPKIAPEGWGSSPEFYYLEKEKNNEEFNNFWIVKTSTLPRSKAANIWTIVSQESNMTITNEKKDAMKEIFGDAAANIISMAEMATKKLEDSGIRHKDEAAIESVVEPAVVEEPVEEPVEEKVEEKVEEPGDIAKEIIEGILSEIDVNFAQPVIAAVNDLTEKVETLGERVKELESDQDIAGKLTVPKYVNQLRLNAKVESVSKNDKTVVGENDEFNGPKETQVKTASVADTFFSQG